MSNFKYLIIFFCMILLVSCKPSSLGFKEESNLNKKLFEQLPLLAGYKGMTIDSVTVYKARLEEQVIDRDDVSEYKLINDKSKKSNAVGFPISGNYQHLYLFLLHTKPESAICLYMSTGFNANDECTNLGPGLLGNLRMNQINFTQPLTVREHGGVYQFQKSKQKTRLHFYLDDEELNKQPASLKVYQIIRNMPNRVSGLKPVIMKIGAIFNDPDALFFSYEATYK